MSILRISANATVFSFISILILFMALLQYGITNDYIIYNLQNITETLEGQNQILPGTSAETQKMADDYRLFNFYFDHLWFAAYLVFLISTLILAYQSRPMNYFHWVFFLIYGIMFVLFVLSIFEELTSWFYNEIFLAIIPTAVILLPKFNYYLTNIGIFTTVHIALCLVLNLADFGISEMAARRKQEKKGVDDNEVV